MFHCVNTSVIYYERSSNHNALFCWTEHFVSNGKWNINFKYETKQQKKNAESNAALAKFQPSTNVSQSESMFPDVTNYMETKRE